MTAPLVEVAGLTKRFALRGGGVVHAVSDVGFAIDAGEIFALVGESGSGKTTVGRMILRLIDPSAGAIRFDGTDIGNLSQAALRPLRRHMQIVFQDPFGSLNPFMRVGEAIVEPLAILGVDAVTRARRLAELLDLVGLPQAAAGRHPHQFSGGQRQRIAIARAIAAGPKFLVADEAVSALDVSIQAQVLNLLAELQARLHLTMLFISHDLSVVRHIADRVGVMYAGRLVETGPAEAVIAAPAHPYTQALVAAAPSVEAPARGRRAAPRGEPPSLLAPPPGCAFAARCPHAVDACRAAVPAWRVLDAGRGAACLLPHAA